MTDRQRELALPRLRRSLGLGSGEGDEAVLTDALEQGEEKICRYLQQDSLPQGSDWLLVELAVLSYQRMTHPDSEKTSESYTEGQLSQSASYLTPAERTAGEEQLLRSLAHLRQVKSRGNST